MSLVSSKPVEVSVFVERAGADKFLYPGCFSCRECGEIKEVTRPLPPTQGQEFTVAEERFWHNSESPHGKTCLTCHGIIHPQVSRQVRRMRPQPDGGQNVQAAPGARRC